MRVDELYDLTAQPQQDKIVKVKVGGELKDFDVTIDHESGFFVLEVAKDA